MPFRARHSLFEKRNWFHCLQNLLLPQSPQVTFVPVRDCRQPPRQQSHRLHSPSRVIHPRHRMRSPQLAKQSPLQRRLRHQRPVNIEKRCHAPLLFYRPTHPASPRASSPALVADKLLARNLRPPTSSSNPPTTQKTRANQPIEYLPARLASCMS